LDRDARLAEKGISRKIHGEDRHDLMSRTAFMGVNILHEDRRPDGLHQDAQLFLKLADERGLRRFAELDRAPERTHPLHPARIVQNLSRQQPVAAPMETQRLETDL